MVCCCCWNITEREERRDRLLVTMGKREREMKAGVSVFPPPFGDERERRMGSSRRGEEGESVDRCIE